MGNPRWLLWVKPDMSETKRKKKDGENRDNQGRRMETGAIDEKQNAEQSKVAEPRSGDSFDEDLKRDNKNKPRGENIGTSNSERG